MSNKKIDTSDLPYTRLPDNISVPLLKSDVTASNLQAVNQYNAYLSMGTENGLLLAKQYLIEHPEILQHLITADDILKLSHDNVALQRMFFQDIEEYIMSVVSFEGEYSSEAPYKRYNVILYNGMAYFCHKDAQPGILPTNEEYFYPITLKGIKGEPGINFVSMGEWNSSTTYSANHAVSWNGKLWYSVADFNTGNEPNDESAYWKKFLELSQNASDIFLTDGTTVQEGIDNNKENLASVISDIDSKYAKKTDLDYLDILSGTGAPSTSTEGKVRQYYKDTSSDTYYECLGGNTSDGYIWRKIIKDTDLMEPKEIFKFATSTSTSGYPNISTIDHKFFVIDVGDNNILKYYDTVTSKWKPITSVWS